VLRFFNLLQTRYQYEIFHESFSMVKDLIGNFYFDKERGIELKVPDGGATAAIVEYTSADLVREKRTTPQRDHLAKLRGL